jgi:excinuclease ABC subunit B
VGLRSLVEGTTEEEVMRRLKQGARKGSAHATRRRYKPRKH